MRKHVFLMGYRGCGKSTVGRVLAAQLSWDFVDTDDWVEDRAGRSIADIFATDGEGAFRDLESQALIHVGELPKPTIVSLGGGAILRESNREQIQAAGRVVWLRADPETLFARIQADGTSPSRRPSLSAGSGFDEVVQVLSNREPIYQKLADLCVETGNRTPDEIVSEIAGWVNSEV